MIRDVNWGLQLFSMCVRACAVTRSFWQLFACDINQCVQAHDDNNKKNSLSSHAHTHTHSYYSLPCDDGQQQQRLQWEEERESETQCKNSERLEEELHRMPLRKELNTQ